MSGRNALVGLRRRHRARRRRQLPADAVPAAQRHAQPAGDRPQRDPDHRAGVGVQQHVRHHLGDPPPADGDAVVYFIVLVNVAKGLRQVEPTHVELLRSYAATPTQVLRKARIPNAVPYLFTAIKIAAPTP